MCHFVAASLHAFLKAFTKCFSNAPSEASAMGIISCIFLRAVISPPKITTMALAFTFPVANLASSMVHSDAQGRGIIPIASPLRKEHRLSQRPSHPRQQSPSNDWPSITVPFIIQRSGLLVRHHRNVPLILPCVVQWWFMVAVVCCVINKVKQSYVVVVLWASGRWLSVSSSSLQAER